MNKYADEDRAALYMVADMVKDEYVGKTLEINYKDGERVWHHKGVVADVYVDRFYIVLKFEDGTLVDYEALSHADLDIT